VGGDGGQKRGERLGAAVFVEVFGHSVQEPEREAAGVVGVTGFCWQLMG
jgi:hypothetical protein